MSIEVHLFLPQMRISFPALIAKARAVEAAGFTGIALMDHLAPPMAIDQPMFDAMVAASWIAASTERLTVGHLVLCDAMRHPAVLAKQAVSIDHGSGGRFELGIGWGSVPKELEVFGVGSLVPRDRVARLAETLDVVTALWAGERVDYAGEHHTIRRGQQRPVPIERIPIVIGGVGKKTMALVDRHADWWNVPVHELHRLDELRPSAGTARVSVQEMITYVPDPATRDEALALADRRFGSFGSRIIGDSDVVRAHLAELEARGIERVYAWFTDFADEDNLRRFGAEVISAS
jgi:alkanesulfonate monooxygenase SsuD/methylene tetrahydromethanopterin reductase-like flavin-dependent oxidoreductase (luciferase family)